MTAAWRQRGHRGSAVAIEATLIIPALVLFVALVVVLARDALTDQTVGGAASQAARAASLERSPAQARAAANSAADSTLLNAGIVCVESGVQTDVSGLSAPPGQPSIISVTVSCVIHHDVSLPGFPQTRRVTQTRTSPIDTYRGR